MSKKFLFIILMMSILLCFSAYAQPQGDMPAPPFEFNGEMPDFNGERPQGMPPQGERMQRPSEQIPENMPPQQQNNEVPQNENSNNMNQQPIETNTPETETKEQNTPENNNFGGMGGRWGNFNNQAIPEETNFWVEYGTAVISIILLALAYIFVIFYKRKRY